jgi:hypothetical protein
MLHAVREISKVTRNNLDLRHIHVKEKQARYNMTHTYMTSVITNVTKLAPDNNRFRYTTIGSNPYQSLLLYVIDLMDN